MGNDAAYLQQIEVSVELSTFSILQPFELSCDEHENVLQSRENSQRLVKINGSKWQHSGGIRIQMNSSQSGVNSPERCNTVM